MREQKGWAGTALWPEQGDGVGYNRRFGLLPFGNIGAWRAEYAFSSLSDLCKTHAAFDTSHVFQLIP